MWPFLGNFHFSVRLIGIPGYMHAYAHNIVLASLVVQCEHGTANTASQPCPLKLFLLCAFEIGYPCYGRVYFQFPKHLCLIVN